MSEEVDRRVARDRRRFARRQWARRWLAWRLVAAVVVVVLLVGGGVYAVFFSSWLEVEDVAIRGADTLEGLTTDDVREAAEVPTGEPLARVDLDAIERKVGSLAAVRSVEVSRQWPHEVLIEVEGRVAVAVVQVGEELRGLDADGVMFGSLRRPPADLPMVESVAGATGDALQEAATVAGSLDKGLLADVDHLEVESVDRISLVLRDDRVVQWGSAEQSEEKARVLETLLSIRASTYDVSVPGSPTTRP